MLVYKYMHGNRHGPPGLITLQLPNSNYNLRQRYHQLQILMPQHSRQLTADIPLYRSFATWNSLIIGDYDETTTVLNGPCAGFQTAISDGPIFTAISALHPTFYPIFVHL